MIVADANLIVYLLIAGPFSEDANRVLLKDPAWAAPLLWRSEVSNVLGGYVRRGGMELRGALERFRRATVLLGGREHAVDFSEVLRLAAVSGCSAYDCQYVLVARSMGVPLVTLDRRVLAAFPEVAVSITDFAAN